MDAQGVPGTSTQLEETGSLENLLRLWVPQADQWLNSNDRRHRHAQAKLTKAWRVAAADAVPLGWPTFEQPVRIVASIWKSRNGAYDAGNLYPTAKACVDGFRDSKLLIEDSNEYVIGPDMRHGGKGAPGLLFMFVELPQITTFVR